MLLGGIFLTMSKCSINETRIWFGSKRLKVRFLSPVIGGKLEGLFQFLDSYSSNNCWSTVSNVVGGSF